MAVISTSSGRIFESETERSILDAAEVAGLSFPYSCRNGRCSACKCKLLQGQTRVLHTNIGLSSQEQSEGWILSCAHAPLSDIVIDIEEYTGPPLPPKATFPCRISSISALSSDVIRVTLRLPPKNTFRVLPGQYIQLIGPRGIRRDYSVANLMLPGDEIELHIRRVPDGAMSSYWFDVAKVNDLLRIYGPLGTFLLRASAETDVIFIATGTGMAPVKAMLEEIANSDLPARPRSVTVLWGGRLASDLYLDPTTLLESAEYIPTLTRAGAEWTGASGRVQDVLLRRFPRFEHMQVYACGSDNMIRNASMQLREAGLPRASFYSDAFVASS